MYNPPLCNCSSFQKNIHQNPQCTCGLKVLYASKIECANTGNEVVRKSNVPHGNLCKHRKKCIQCDCNRAMENASYIPKQQCVRCNRSIPCQKRTPQVCKCDCAPRHKCFERSQRNFQRTYSCGYKQHSCIADACPKQQCTKCLYVNQCQYPCFLQQKTCSPSSTCKTQEILNISCNSLQNIANLLERKVASHRKAKSCTPIINQNSQQHIVGLQKNEILQLVSPNGELLPLGFMQLSCPKQVTNLEAWVEFQLSDLTSSLCKEQIQICPHKKCKGVTNYLEEQSCQQQPCQNLEMLLTLLKAPPPCECLSEQKENELDDKYSVKQNLNTSFSPLTPCDCQAKYSPREYFQQIPQPYVNKFNAEKPSSVSPSGSLDELLSIIQDWWNKNKVHISSPPAQSIQATNKGMHVQTDQKKHFYEVDSFQRYGIETNVYHGHIKMSNKNIQQNVHRNLGETQNYQMVSKESEQVMYQSNENESKESNEIEEHDLYNIPPDKVTEQAERRVFKDSNKNYNKCIPQCKFELLQQKDEQQHFMERSLYTAETMKYDKVTEQEQSMKQMKQDKHSPKFSNEHCISQKCKAKLYRTPQEQQLAEQNESIKQTKWDMHGSKLLDEYCRSQKCKAELYHTVQEEPLSSPPRKHKSKRRPKLKPKAIKPMQPYKNPLNKESKYHKDCVPPLPEMNPRQRELVPVFNPIQSTKYRYLGGEITPKICERRINYHKHCNPDLNTFKACSSVRSRRSLADVPRFTQRNINSTKQCKPVNQMSPLYQKKCFGTPMDLAYRTEKSTNSCTQRNTFPKQTDVHNIFSLWSVNHGLLNSFQANSYNISSNPVSQSNQVSDRLDDNIFINHQSYTNKCFKSIFEQPLSDSISQVNPIFKKSTNSDCSYNLYPDHFNTSETQKSSMNDETEPTAMPKSVNTHDVLSTSIPWSNVHLKSEHISKGNKNNPISFHSHETDPVKDIMNKINNKKQSGTSSYQQQVDTRNDYWKHHLDVLGIAKTLKRSEINYDNCTPQYINLDNISSKKVTFSCMTGADKQYFKEMYTQTENNDITLSPNVSTIDPVKDILGSIDIKDFENTSLYLQELGERMTYWKTLTDSSRSSASKSPKTDSFKTPTTSITVGYAITSTNSSIFDPSFSTVVMPLQTMTIQNDASNLQNVPSVLTSRTWALPLQTPPPTIPLSPLVEIPRQPSPHNNVHTFSCCPERSLSTQTSSVVLKSITSLSEFAMQRKFPRHSNTVATQTSSLKLYTESTSSNSSELDIDANESSEEMQTSSISRPNYLAEHDKLSLLLKSINLHSNSFHPLQSVSLSHTYETHKIVHKECPYCKYHKSEASLPNTQDICKKLHLIPSKSGTIGEPFISSTDSEHFIMDVDLCYSKSALDFTEECFHDKLPKSSITTPCCLERVQFSLESNQSSTDTPCSLGHLHTCSAVSANVNNQHSASIPDTCFRHEPCFILPSCILSDKSTYMHRSNEEPCLVSSYTGTLPSDMYFSAKENINLYSHANMSFRDTSRSDTKKNIKNSVPSKSQAGNHSTLHPKTYIDTTCNTSHREPCLISLFHSDTCKTESNNKNVHFLNLMDDTYISQMEPCLRPSLYSDIFQVQTSNIYSQPSKKKQCDHSTYNASHREPCLISSSLLNALQNEDKDTNIQSFENKMTKEPSFISLLNPNTLQTESNQINVQCFEYRTSIHSTCNTLHQHPCFMSSSQSETLQTEPNHLNIQPFENKTSTHFNRNTLNGDPCLISPSHLNILLTESNCIHAHNLENRASTHSMNVESFENGNQTHFNCKTLHRKPCLISPSYLDILEVHAKNMHQNPVNITIPSHHSKHHEGFHEDMCLISPSYLDINANSFYNHSSTEIMPIEEVAVTSTNYKQINNESSNVGKLSLLKPKFTKSKSKEHKKKSKFKKTISNKSSQFTLFCIPVSKQRIYSSPASYNPMSLFGGAIISARPRRELLIPHSTTH